VPLAYELNAAGDYDDAVATIDKALALTGAARSASSADAELSEVEVDALHVRAILRTVSGDVEGAIHDYEDVIRKDRHNPPVYRVHARLNLGNELSKAGRHDEALHVLEEAEGLSRDLGFHDGTPGAVHGSACTLMAMGRLADAENQMRANVPALLATRDPVDVLNAAEGYGLLASKQGRHQDAARLLGAWDGLQRNLEIHQSGIETATLEDARAQARETLGPRWDELFDEGARVGVHEVFRSLSVIP
jgi:tetratricopeptide (TPR) repeat protein